MRRSFSSWRYRSSPLRERLDAHPGVRIGLLIVVVVSLASLFPRGSVAPREFPEGSVWNEDDLIAAFPFPVFRDPDVVAREEREAEAATPLSFDRIDSVSIAVKDSITVLMQRIADICDRQISIPNVRRGDELLRLRADSLDRLRGRTGLPVHFGAGEWMVLFRIRMRESRERVQPFRNITGMSHRAVDEVIRRGYLDREKRMVRHDQIALATGAGIDEVVPVRQFLDITEIPLYLRDRLAVLYPEQRDVWTVVITVTYPLLRPNIVENPSRSLIAMQAARERVQRTEGIVKENERIVSRHERVTPEIKSRIDSYYRARIERSGNVNVILQFIGKIGHVVALLFPFVIYLTIFRRRIVGSNSRILLISLLFLFEGLLAWLSFSADFSEPAKFLILVPAAAMLLAVMFDSRVAFYGTVSLSFLVGALRGNDYSLILASVLSGALSIYTVRDIKHRSQIFRSLAFILLGYAFAIAVDGLQRSTPLPLVTTELLFALGNALLSPVLTFGLLALFERGFGITTDLTLLELSDFNHPLLRDLSSRAPGTFHHSIVMGSLAEAAAQNIGASAILARVGAYYHDIGKMLEPEYFVENQIGQSNIHDELEPKESARHILNHVIRGIELGREYGLPERVIDFIPAHHGTTFVSYFLEKARSVQPDQLDTDTFRYPGPRPQTRETAIVMLADTIEAAARAIEEPTIEKIEKLIEGVINKRLAEGELDDCDLTFRDLTTVKRTFLNILTGIHHSRIKYPTEGEAEAARKLAERTTRLLNLPSAAEALTRRIRKLDSF